MKTLTLFLAGDVMTGRGVDQMLPHPCNPALFEDHVQSADQYIALAERTLGPIDRPIGFDAIWGDALEVLSRWKPDARIVNLETAVTAEGTPEAKGINYRMHPANLPVLVTAGIDCCSLANNHVLDWGEAGLRDTLIALDTMGIKRVGAGLTVSEAKHPAIIEVQPGHRICVYAAGSTTSGTPLHWAVGERHFGIHLLPDLSSQTAEKLSDHMRSRKLPGDLTILSVHWGSNWDYDIPREQRDFAHSLIDSGACDIVHGHSSHHPRGVEIYRGKLILYGCGDFINDYEGIGGKEAYRGDLSVMYLPRIDPGTGMLEALSLEIFQMRHFRLQRASPEDVSWLQAVLNRESSRFGAEFVSRGNGLEAGWKSICPSIG